MYVSANANLTPYGAGPRMWLMALCGKLLGVQFKVNGLPFGANYNRALWDRFSQTERGAQTSDSLARMQQKKRPVDTAALGPVRGE